LEERSKLSFIQKIRCALVHEQVLFRQGLRRLLEDAPDMEVVAEAGNAEEALQCVFEHRPEIVIADASVFDLEAEQAQQLILQESPQTKVLFLTTHEYEDDRRLRECRAYGATCVIRKTSAEDLLQTVRKIHPANSFVREMHRAEWAVEPHIPPARSLTTREQEVLKLLAEGRTVRSAAASLGLSAKTVDAHKFNLMRKLGVHNKAELVMWAIQKKVVKLPVSH
jgi:two-component system, NarL family, response regulator NreC